MTESKRIDPELREAVETSWKRRVRTQGFSPQTEEYRSAEIEFFAGAMSALVAKGYQIPTYWVIPIMIGDPVVADPTDVES